MWPVLDEIAAHTYLVNSTVVLIFAIYYQIAVVWGLLLISYIVQVTWFGRLHWQYRESGAKVFEENQRRQSERKVEKVGPAQKRISQVRAEDLNSSVFRRSVTNSNSLRLMSESGGSQAKAVSASQISNANPLQRS